MSGIRIRVQGLAGMAMAVSLSAMMVSPAVAAGDQAVYKKECSSCHIAYPADFLPKRSWEKLMSSLDKHFNENAELGAEESKAIQSYLTSNAADVSGSKYGARVMRHLGASETPLRITELAYFKRRHHEISREKSIGNPEVRSMSRCDACHTRAEEGSFSEREIKIPGYGTWED